MALFRFAILNSKILQFLFGSVLLFTPLPTPAQTSSATSSDITRPLSRIIREHFLTCDGYLTIDGHFLSNSTSQYVSSWEKSHYTFERMLIILAETLQLPIFTFNIDSDSKLQIFGEENNTGNNPCLQTSCFPSTNRKYSQCSVTLSFFHKGSETLSRWMNILVIPFRSPLKNEQDHFIFILQTPQQVAQFLQNTSLSILKYKLGIPLFTPKEIEAKSVYFFDKYGGSRLCSINIEESSSMIDLFPDFTRNGFGHHLRISAPPKYPFLFEIELGNDKIWTSKRGVFHFLIDSLLHHFNFTPTVFPSTGLGSGKQFPNGTWNGVVGDVLYGLADFGTSSTPNVVRYPLVSFTSAIVYPYVSFMIGPPQKTYSWKAIYWPFAPHLWFAVILSLVVTIAAFKVMKISPVEDASSLFYHHLVQYMSFSLIGQGLPYPTAHFSRLLLAVWLIAAMIFNTLYVSKIVGLLAFPVYQIQPKTFQELVEYTGFSWGFDHSGGNLFAHFQSSSNPVFRQIFERMENEKDAVSCFDTALKRNFACITWAGVADYIAYRNLTLRHGKNPLIFSDEITLFVACGLTMPMRTVLKRNFDSTLGMVRDSGQGNKWLKEDLENLRREKVHWERKIMNDDDENQENRKQKTVDGPDLLGLRNLLGVFLVYAVGHALAGSGFLIEKIIVTWSHNLLCIRIFKNK